MARPAVTVSEFRVGSVLGRGFSILFRKIVPFGLLSLVIMSPPYIYALAVERWYNFPDFGGYLGNVGF